MKHNKITTITNLTPHEINVVLPNGETRSFPPSGTVLRVETRERPVSVIDGIPVSQTEFGGIDLEFGKLPKEGYFIVSRLVKQAIGEDSRFLVPGAPIRDPEGKIVGCKGFSL